MKTTQKEFDKMVEIYEKGGKATLPKSFVDYYEKGYGLQLTQSKIEELIEGYVSFETIRNPYTGVDVKLNPMEVALYDYIMGVEKAPMYGISTTKEDRMLAQECKMWFADNNRKVYMLLID